MRAGPTWRKVYIDEVWMPPFHLYPTEDRPWLMASELSELGDHDFVVGPEYIVCTRCSVRLWPYMRWTSARAIAVRPCWVYNTPAKAAAWLTDYLLGAMWRPWDSTLKAGKAARVSPDALLCAALAMGVLEASPSFRVIAKLPIELRARIQRSPLRDLVSELARVRERTNFDN